MTEVVAVENVNPSIEGTYDYKSEDSPNLIVIPDGKSEDKFSLIQNPITKDDLNNLESQIEKYLPDSEITKREYEFQTELSVHKTADEETVHGLELTCYDNRVFMNLVLNNYRYTQKQVGNYIFQDYTFDDIRLNKIYDVEKDEYSAIEITFNLIMGKMDGIYIVDLAKKCIPESLEHYNYYLLKTFMDIQINYNKKVVSQFEEKGLDHGWLNREITICWTPTMFKTKYYQSFEIQLLQNDLIYFKTNLLGIGAKELDYQSMNDILEIVLLKDGDTNDTIMNLANLFTDFQPDVYHPTTNNIQFFYYCHNPSSNYDVYDRDMTDKLFIKKLFLNGELVYHGYADCYYYSDRLIQRRINLITHTGGWQVRKYDDTKQSLSKVVVNKIDDDVRAQLSINVPKIVNTPDMWEAFIVKPYKLNNYSKIEIVDDQTVKLFNQKFSEDGDILVDHTETKHQSEDSKTHHKTTIMTKITDYYNDGKVYGKVCDIRKFGFNFESKRFETNQHRVTIINYGPYCLQYEEIDPCDDIPGLPEKTVLDKKITKFGKLVYHGICKNKQYELLTNRLKVSEMVKFKISPGSLTHSIGKLGVKIDTFYKSYLFPKEEEIKSNPKIKFRFYYSWFDHNYQDDQDGYITGNINDHIMQYGSGVSAKLRGITASKVETNDTRVKNINNYQYKHGHEESNLEIDEHNYLLVKSIDKKELEKGRFGYKAARTNDNKMCIVKLFIPEDAQVAWNHQPTYGQDFGKFRTNKANVLWIKPVIYKNNTFYFVDDFETYECPVCMDEEATHMGFPCRHKLCSGCWEEVLKTGGQKCPFCKGLIKKTMELDEELVKINKDMDEDERSLKEAYSCVHTDDFVYKLNHEVTVNNFERDLDTVCAPGIHYQKKVDDVFKWFEYLDVPDIPEIPESDGFRSDLPWDTPPTKHNYIVEVDTYEANQMEIDYDSDNSNDDNNDNYEDTMDID